MATDLQVIFPRDGDVLNRHDGVETEQGLKVTVRGRARADTRVLVNGREAARSGDAFTAETLLERRYAPIAVEAGQERARLEVWWDKGSRKRYRFSSDDNILFLKDLAVDAARYRSLFDHWYLGFWREMHDAYGAKIHVNIYYQTDGFDLTQMPDRWKDEWRGNTDWLRLSFHALQDKPDRPYRNAQYAQMAHDYDLVCGHIRRFAGVELIGNTTTVHWAECPKDGMRALRDRGIERVIGLFTVREGVCTTGYYLSPEQCAYCDTRGAWYDRETGLMFVRCGAVVNALEVEQIPDFLDARAASPSAGEMMELLIHEQYFRQELALYQPTVKDKVRVALDWATRHGYEPVFWGDGFLGT